MENAYVYILTNHKNKVFYVGVTSDLVKRIWQHKQKLVKGFTRQKYDTTKLVYFETIESIISAIQREKFIKGKSKSYKLDLIVTQNPEFADLYESIM